MSSDLRTCHEQLILHPINIRITPYLLYQVHYYSSDLSLSDNTGTAINEIDRIIGIDDFGWTRDVQCFEINSLVRVHNIMLHVYGCTIRII